jgi:putative PEP-CTERM system TPR-repeat lipoprotein
MKRLINLRRIAAAAAAAFFLAASGPGLGQTASPSEGAAKKSAAETYEQALGAFNLGEIRTAYIFSKSALQADPFLLPAHLLLAKIFLQLGHGDRAEKELLIAKGLGAHRSLILIPLARAYLLQDKASQLINEIFPLGNLPEEDAELLALRGEAHLQLDQLYDARRAFTQALERHPRSVPAILGRIKVLLGQGDLIEAAIAAKTAVEISPNNGQAWYLKGTIARAQGNSDIALTDFTRASELLPALLPAQIGRIGILLDLGRLGEAEEAIAAVRAIYPNDPRTLYLDAIVKGRRGMDKEATLALQGAADLLAQLPRELIDGHPPTLLLAGIVSYSLKQWDQATDYLSAYIERFPDAVGPRLLLAQIALDRQQQQTAIEALEPALARAPNDQRVLSLLAEAYMREGQHLKASQLLQLALEAGSDNAALRAQRAVNQFGLGRQGEAIEALGAVFDAQPALTSAGATLVVMLLTRHRYDEAVDKARRLVVEQGPNPTYINLFGVAALAKGDLEAAHWAFSLVLALEPGFLPSKLNLAELALRQGGGARAREQLDAIIAAHPDNVAAMILLARSLEAQGQFEEARRSAERALEADPMAVPVVIYLTELLLKMKEAPAALSVAEGLEARSPTIDDVGLLATLSRAYVANGQRSAAQAILQRGSSLAGYDAHSLLIIADLQRDAGDLKGAVWSLQKAMEGEPSSLQARIKLGEIHADLGDNDKAAQVAQGLLKDFPDKPYGLHLLGSVQQKEGDDRGALDQFRAALGLEDSPVLAVLVYGAERRVNGDAAAITFLRDWLKRHPDDQIAGVALAEGYSAVHDWKSAAQLYEQVISKAPDNPLLLNNLALVYLQLKDPRALDLAQRAQRAWPGSAEIGDTLGWVMVRTGDVTEGLKYLRDAQSRLGASPGLVYHIAYALNELGRQPEALAGLEQVTASDQTFAEREEALALLVQLRPVPAGKGGGKGR